MHGSSSVNLLEGELAWSLGFNLTTKTGRSFYVEFGDFPMAFYSFDHEEEQVCSLVSMETELLTHS